MCDTETVPDDLDGVELFQPDYILPQASKEARLLAGRTIANHAYLEESHHMQIKIQPFKEGGYEATVRWVDAQMIADMQHIERRRGIRLPPEERSMDSIERSRTRARQRVRLHTKNIRANRLITLTKRETEETGYSTLEDWQKDWARFCRVYKKYFPEQPFLFVAVPEQHKGGKHFHLHIATYSKQKMPLELMRRIWWEICGGRGMGNIDVQYIKQHGDHAIDRIARYISKYISKSFDDIERFNRKRYWVSNNDLPEARRLWLRARDLGGAISEVFYRFGGAMKFDNSGGGIFIFPDQSGFWFSVHPGQGSAPPF